MNRKSLGCVVCLLMFAGSARADNWTIHMTVDNQFDCYFGTPTATNFFAGSGNNWQVTYTFNANGRLPPTISTWRPPRTRAWPRGSSVISPTRPHR